MIDTEQQNGQPVDAGAGKRVVLLPWLSILFIGSAALGLYFLIAPAFGPDRYYKVGVHTSVYGPLWMYTTWGVAKLAGNNMVLAMIQLKLIILAIDLTVMGLLLSQAR